MPPPSIHPREGHLKDLQKMAADGRLYAILDACDEPTVPPKVHELGPEKAVSLYQGQAEHEQWAVAPYLVKVDAVVLEWIFKTLWKNPWGIFIVAECGLDELRKHFRHFLIVQEPDGQTMYFRYYDPRILEVFLPTCTREELDTFFGPLKAYAIGSPEGEGVKFLLNIPD